MLSIDYKLQINQNQYNRVIKKKKVDAHRSPEIIAVSNKLISRNIKCYIVIHLWHLEHFLDIDKNLRNYDDKNQTSFHYTIN